MVIHKALFLLLWRKRDGKLACTSKDHTGPFPRLARERTVRQQFGGNVGVPHITGYAVSPPQTQWAPTGHVAETPVPAPSRLAQGLALP